MNPPPKSPWTSERIAAYRIVRALPCATRTLWRIWNKHRGRLEEFLSRPNAWEASGCSKAQSEMIRSAKEDVEKEIAEMDGQDVHFLLPWDEDFPTILAGIPDPPASLFLRGRMSRDALRIAVVGTRKMTSYGKECTAHLVEELVGGGVTIVSGLAFGIDSVAHHTALENGGITIAALPSGVTDNSIMPQTHRSMAGRICETGGALLSENAPGTPTLPFQYLHRNRLISGLSDAIIVVEADADSGALTTAKLGLEQGREILAVPGSIWSSVSRGTNLLIKQGASPCTSAQDVWDALQMREPERASNVAEMRQAFPATPEEQALLDALVEPMDIDDLVRRLKLPASEVLSRISMLEMKGRISHIETGKYGIVGGT